MKDMEGADMEALIAYVTTLSKIHGKRVSIFTTTDSTGKEFTRCEFGFGSGARIMQGHGGDVHEVARAI